MVSQFIKTGIFVFALFIVTESSAQNIDFKAYDNWEQVVADAKKANKHIFVDVYTDWCSWCKKLDKDVFTAEGVASYYNKTFINIKLNAEDGAMGEKFAEKNGVNGFPTLLYFSPQGKWVHRISGYRDPGDFVDAGWDAVNPERQLVSYETKFEKGEKSLEFLRTYIHAINEAGLDNSSAIQTYIAQLNDADYKDSTHWAVISYNFYDTDSEYFYSLLENKKSLEVSHGTASVNQFFEHAYSYKIYEIGKSEDAKALNSFISQVKSSIPDLAEKLTAYAQYIFYKDDEENGHKYAQKYLTMHCSNSNELNAAAWKYFENEEDEIKLNEALFWVLKSIRLDKNWYNTDTQANLLLKLGRLEEAKKAAINSIEIARRDGMDPEETELLLEKINDSLESR
ncbi:MAG: thioredoxin family protein [Chitinophagales bacterium]|nr:thioredoxin family protein [Chitinophagales bacterium]